MTSLTFSFVPVLDEFLSGSFRNCSGSLGRCRIFLSVLSSSCSCGMFVSCSVLAAELLVGCLLYVLFFLLAAEDFG